MTADEFPQERDGTPHYMPTPAEIKAACAEIQAGWSVDEEQRRRTWSIPPEPVTMERLHRQYSDE